MTISQAVALFLAGIGAYQERDFLRSSFDRATDTSIYRQEFPIKISNSLPSMEQIAQTIFSSVSPAHFMFGASTSEHQGSKECTPDICNWSAYAQENNLARPTDARYTMDWYHNAPAYLKDAKTQLPGFNTVRFSTEFALLQPEGPDSWDKDVADHYANLFITMLKMGITPVVCFHHYTDPLWFQERGGFEKEGNINYFSDTCIKLYTHIMRAVKRDKAARDALHALGPRVPLWVTFNAPDGYAFRGYYAKGGPPGIKDIALTAEVLKNTLEAHVRVYHGIKHAFKKIKLSKELVPQVGFLKNIHQVDPARETTMQRRLSALNNLVLGFADQIQNRAVYNFFIKGEFWAQIPIPGFKVDLRYKNLRAVGATDFVGLNYYSNRYQFFTTTVPIKDETLRTSGATYYHYPYGMYRAIIELHERLLKPMNAVTGKNIYTFCAENGIATDDNAKRARFYHEYLYAISRAVKDGYKVYGYIPWTFFDNYEWPAMGDTSIRNYGVFAVSNDGKHLTLKKGSRPLKLFGQALEDALKKEKTE